MTIFKTVEALVRAIINASLCKVIMITVPNLTKKSRSTGEPTPSKFAGLLKVTSGVFGIGFNYEDGIKRSITASGNNPDDFTVQKASGRSKVADCPNGILEVSDKNPEQFYVQLFRKVGKMTGVVKCFYINPSHEVIEPTKQEIADYFPLEKELPEKQIEAGCDDNRVSMPCSPKVEGIVYLKKGEKVFDNLTPKLKKLLKSELE